MVGWSVGLSVGWLEHATYDNWLCPVNLDFLDDKFIILSYCILTSEPAKRRMKIWLVAYFRIARNRDFRKKKRFTNLALSETDNQKNDNQKYEVSWVLTWWPTLGIFDACNETGEFLIVDNYLLRC